MPKSVVYGSSALRKNLLTRDFTNSCHHHHILLFLFSKPAISMLEQVDGLIISRSVSRVGGGVHGHKAIVSFLFLVSTVDPGAPKSRQLMIPFSANSTCADSTRASEALSPVTAPGCTHLADRELVVFDYYRVGTPQVASCN